MDRKSYQSLQRLANNQITIGSKKEKQVVMAALDNLFRALAVSEGKPYVSAMTILNSAAKLDEASTRKEAINREIQALRLKPESVHEIAEREIESIQSQLDEAQNVFEQHKKSFLSELKKLQAMLASKQQMVAALKECLGANGLAQAVGCMWDSLSNKERCFWLHVLAASLKESSVIDGLGSGIDPRVGKLRYTNCCHCLTPLSTFL